MVKTATRSLKNLWHRKQIVPDAPSPLLSLIRQHVGEEHLAGCYELRHDLLEERFLAPLMAAQLVTAAEWLQALEEMLKCPGLNLEEADPSPSVALSLPKELGEAHRVACVDLDEHGLTLAMVDPLDESAVQEVEARTDFKVKHRMVVLASQLKAFQAVLYGTSRVLAVSPRDIIDQVFQRALECGASDIHIEPLEDEISVRFRQDGILVDGFDIRSVAPKKTMLRHLKSALAVVVKNKSGASGKTMNIAETQRPQDGRIYLPGRKIDMRVSVLPTVHGESVVIRIHSPESDQVELDCLGFSPQVLPHFESLIAAPYGIFLVSGPTGSGKTTTLYSVLRRLNHKDRKILTIEDPVEYQIPGVMQIQTNEARELNFASALRSFLRHDPDIIMVGEIRDESTAVMAVEASLTGHLVLSTVHANDSVRTITRLRDLGVHPTLIASTCLGTMAQRLIRLSCPKCRQPAKFGRRFWELVERYGVEVDESRLCAGAGCAHCNHTGYRGRTAIHELLCMTPEMRELISHQGSEGELVALARSQGTRLLAEDALDKVVQGLTTEAELMRVTLQDKAGS